MNRKIVITLFFLVFVSLGTAEPWISEVNINPDNPEPGQQIEVTATGEDSGRIISLQAKADDNWESRYCDTFYICENDDNPWTFSFDDSGSHEIKVRALNQDYEYSDEATRTVEVSEDGSTDLVIDNSNAEHVGDGNVEFTLNLDKDAPSDFSCRLSDNDRITTFDDKMDRDADSEFSLTKKFDDGSFTRYMGCLNDEGELVTKSVSEDFEVDTEEDYHIQSSESEHVGNGDVEFEINLNKNLPSDYSCRLSDNNRITSFDDLMVREDESTFSAESQFDDGSHTVYFGCLDSSEDLVTNKAEESFTVDRESEDYKISSANVDKMGGGDVEFEINLNRNLPSDYSCRWSDNDVVSSADELMNREEDDEFTAESQFDDGSHTVYFGCLDDSNKLITNKVDKSFSIDIDQPAFFDVDITDANTPISSGETLEVDYRVKNTGDEYDTQEVELVIDGSVKASRDESILPGNSETGTLRWYTSSSRSGTYTATVRTEDSSDSTTVSIGEEDYRIQDINVRKLGQGEVEFEASTSKDLPSGYTCRLSDNERISTIDKLMDRESDDFFTFRETYNEGSHTVYIGCLDLNNNLATDVESKSFRIDEDVDLTLSLSSPLNGADRTPPFTMRWRSSSNQEDPTHTVYVRKYGSSDSLWSSSNKEAYVGESTSYRFTRSLSSGTYDWGVKAESDGETVKRRATFTVPPKITRYDLDVTVEDESGDEVSNAVVTAGSYSDETDSTGFASFNLEEGNYRVVASKDGYLPDSRTITLNRDREITMVLRGSPEDEVYAEFDYIPSRPDVGEKVEFDASRSEGDIVDYSWSFGDGSTGSGRNVEHSYDSRGWYTVSLTVESSDGSTDSISREIYVRDDEENLAEIDVDVEDEENDPIEDARVTLLALSPQSYAVRSVDEDESSERASSSEVGDYRLGFDLDNDELETFAEYSSGYSKVTWDNAVLESSDSERMVVRYDLSGESRRNDYRTYEASQDLELSSGEKEVTMILTMNGDVVEEYTSVIDVPSDHSFEARDTGSGTEYRGTDTRVSASSTPFYSRYTDDDGEAFFEVPSGRYLVTGSKPGYSSDRTTISVDEGESRNVDLELESTDADDEDEDDEDDERVEIQDIRIPASVCEGDSVTARIDVENIGDDELTYTLSVTGLGTTMDRVYHIDEDETNTKVVTLDNVQGSGNQKVSFSTGYDSEERTIQVRDCEVEDGAGLSASVSPKQIRIGSSVRVSGIAEGTGSQEIDISVGGRSVASMSTEPDGRFSTYVIPNRVGNHEVKVESRGRTSSTTIAVLPTVSVNSVDVPNNVFEGEDFEVCGDIESQTAPLVLLKKDGDIIDSKNGRGDICFEVNEKPGTYRYEIQALNRGASNTASRTLKVMEQGSEVSKFPDQIASVESGSGMVKVELYNNKKELRTYEIELEGLPRTWTAQSTKEVKLNSGERSTEYIYVTPKDEGTFEASLNVKSGDEEIYSGTVDISSGGRDRSESIWDRIRNFLSFR